MNNYHAHQQLVKQFKLLATKQIPSLRIFDRHVGLFYAKRFDGNNVEYVPIKINKPGMADCYGLLKTNNDLIHLEFEFKSSDNAKQTSDQVNWENFISNMNGKYFLIRDAECGINQVLGFLNEKKYL